jgi:hypothetical protein
MQIYSFVWLLARMQKVENRTAYKISKILKMKKLFLFLFTLAGLCSQAQQQIVDLSTGVLNNGSGLIAVGNNDDTWTVTPPGTTNAVNIKCASGLWMTPPQGCGRWISPYTDASGYPVAGNTGDFVYSMNFNTSVTATAQNAQIVLNYAGGDNLLSNISVNGYNHAQNLVFNPNAFSQNVVVNLSPVEIKCGQNTIKITLNNAELYTGLLLCGKLTINYGSVLSPAIAGNSNFCANAPLTFTGSDASGAATNSFWEIAQCDQSGNVTPGGYVWNTWTGMVPGAYTFPHGVKPPCDKYYKIKMATQNSCEPWVEANKVIYIKCNPTITITGPQVVCETSGIVLNASGASTYVWVPTNQTGDQVIVHPGIDCQPTCGRGDGKTYYTVTGTAANGCTSTATIGILPFGKNLSIDVSTGVERVSPLTLLPFGSGDPEWKVRGVANSTPYTAAFASLANATVIQPNIQSSEKWVSSTNERWITSKAIGSNPDQHAPATINGHPSGYYWYENNFTIPLGVGYTNIKLNVVEMSADNAVDIYINNPNALTSTPTAADIKLNPNGTYSTFFSLWGPFTVSQPVFKSGTNVLLAGVFNLNKGTPTSPTSSPTGFIMRASVTATCAVTEPCLAKAGADKTNYYDPCASTCTSVQIGTTAVAGYTYSWAPASGLSCTNCAQPFAAPCGGNTYTVTVSSSNCVTNRDVVKVNTASVICADTRRTNSISQEVNGPAEEVMTIYPNPFTDNFTLVYTGSGDIKVEVMDVLGKIIVTQKGSAQEAIKLEMNDKPSGVYLIKVTTPDRSIMKKIIKGKE